MALESVWPFYVAFGRTPPAGRRYAWRSDVSCRCRRR